MASPFASSPASLAIITCNPDPGGAPPSLPAAASRLGPLITQLIVVKAPAGCREGGCGEADVSAQSLVGALVRKLDGQPCNHPREAVLGCGETTLRGPALHRSARLGTRAPTPWAVKSYGTRPSGSANSSSFAATPLPPIPTPSLVLSLLWYPVTGPLFSL